MYDIILLIVLAVAVIIFLPYILALIWGIGKLTSEVLEALIEAIKDFCEFIIDGWKVLIQEVFKNGRS